MPNTAAQHVARSPTHQKRGPHNTHPHQHVTNTRQTRPPHPLHSHHSRKSVFPGLGLCSEIVARPGGTYLMVDRDSLSAGGGIPVLWGLFGDRQEMDESVSKFAQHGGLPLDAG